MIHISNYNEYKTIIEKVKAHGGKVITNSFLMPDFIKYSIEKGNVFADVFDNGALLVFDQGYFYKGIYYFISDETPFLPTYKKPIVIGEVYSINKKTENLVIQDLLVQNFELLSESMYMTLEAESLGNDIHIKTNNYLNVESASENDSEKIIQLWNHVFNPYVDYIPAKAELVEMIKNDCVFCIKENGELSSTIITDITGKVLTIRHLCTSEHFRGRGYAEQLICYCINELHRKNLTKLDLWVENKNIAAKKLYEKLGFIIQDRRSVQIIKK